MMRKSHIVCGLSFLLLLSVSSCNGKAFKKDTSTGTDDKADGIGEEPADAPVTAAPPKRVTKTHTHSYTGAKVHSTLTHFPAVKKDVQWVGTNEDILVLLTKDGLVYYSRTDGYTWKTLGDHLRHVIVDKIQGCNGTSQLLMFSASKIHGTKTYVYDFDAGQLSTVRASFGKGQKVYNWLTLEEEDGKVASAGLTFDSVTPNPVNPTLALAMTVDPNCKSYPSRKDCHVIVWVTGLHGLTSYQLWRPVTLFDDFWLSAEWGTGQEDYHQLFAVRRPNMASFSSGLLVKMNTRQTDRESNSLIFGPTTSVHHGFTVLHNVLMVKREGAWMFALAFDTGSNHKISFALYVTKNDFQTVTNARFPTTHADGSKITGNHLGYDVVDVSEEIFVNVYSNYLQKNLFSRRWGTTYVSGIGGHRYTLSLEYNRRHIGYKSNAGSQTDFHRVGALEGVIIANRLLNPDNKRCMDCPSHEQCDKECSFGTVLSRDNGKTWQPLTPPPGYCQAQDQAPVMDGGDTDDVDDAPPVASRSCSLHLHGATSQDGDLAVDIKPLLSSKTAPGLIVGSGNVGSELGPTTRSLFLSRDGGETWTTLSTGRHLYGEGNYGAMLYLIKHATKTGLLNYTMDSGSSWHSTHFLQEETASKFKWTDVVRVPNQPTRRAFTLFGVDEDSGNVVSAFVKINANDLQTCKASCSVGRADCPPSVSTFVGSSNSQFEYFTPASYKTEEDSVAKRCLMGRLVQYARLKPGKACWQKPSSVIIGSLKPNTKKVYMGLAAPAKTQSCECSYDDYECDWAYHEATNKNGEEALTCKSYFKHPDRIAKLRCHLGGNWYMDTSGYRKIGGDGCHGGKESQLDPKNSTCPTAGQPGQPPKEEDKNWSGFAKFIIFCLVFAMLGLALFAGYRRNATVKDVVDQIVTAASAFLPTGAASSQYRTVSTNEEGNNDSDDDGNNSGDEDQRRSAGRQAAAVTSSGSGGSIQESTSASTTSHLALTAAASGAMTTGIVQAAVVESPINTSSSSSGGATLTMDQPLGVAAAQQGTGSGAATDLIDVFE